MRSGGRRPGIEMSRWMGRSKRRGRGRGPASKGIDAETSSCRCGRGWGGLARLLERRLGRLPSEHVGRLGGVGEMRGGDLG